jgi:hypothetical protein
MKSTTSLSDHSPDAPVSQSSINNLSEHSSNASLAQSSIKQESAPEPSTSGSKTGAQLGLDFQPSDYSVLCSRGRDSVNHVGNRRFRIISSMYVEKYSRSSSKAAKSVIVSEIITAIRQAGGNFCRVKRGKWFEVGDHYAREKVSALLRDLLHTQYRSSNKSKTASRKARKQKKDKPSSQKLAEGTGVDSDDSSLSSSCWGSDKDSLGFNNSQGHDFFDIDVF